MRSQFSSAIVLALTSLGWSAGQPAFAAAPGSNPLFRDKFTADPAPLVVGDELYLYVGHDEAQRDEMFTMREWLVYSTRDMRHWTPHGPVMNVADFKWAKKDAWASQAIAKNGKYWFYAAVEHDDTHPGKAIAVAVADKPTGPFVDAKGAALITNEMTPKGTHSWEDIDPTVFTDTDGTTWIAWGNRQCYIARLKPNMIELDGPITEITPPHFEEGPWLHKRGALYYLTYASLDRAKYRDEKISYSTAPSLRGPWTYRGELTGSGKFSFTIHPGIADFKGRSYLFLHNAVLTIGDLHGAIGRRSVTVEYLHYNPDGTMKPVVQTDAGVSARTARKPRKQWTKGAKRMMTGKLERHRMRAPWRSRARLALVAILVACTAPAPAWAQNDRMTPIATPAQPAAIPLGTGTLPNATTPESWHSQYGSVFARNVTVATLTPFLPDPAKATGAAVVVAPGGGFRTLSMENEGWDVARALAARGVAAFVLKYRLNQTPRDMPAFEASMRAMFSGAASPRRPATGFDEIAPQIADASAAFALIRRRATEWKVDPDRIGMVGFSAGAMLTMATTLSGGDARPAFIGNIYGPLTAMTVPGDAPPMFVALAADDPLFGNSGFGLIDSWRTAKRPVEFHLYEQGGHGFGMYPKTTTSTGWFDAFSNWLRMRNFIRADSAPRTSSRRARHPKA